MTTARSSVAPAASATGLNDRAEERTPAMHDPMRQRSSRAAGTLDDQERRLVGRLGQHLLYAAFGCDHQLTGDADRLTAVLEDLCRRLRLTVLERFRHAYDPHGLTVGLVIGESHVILHTWPEHDVVHVDFFSCVPIDREAVLEELAASLGAERIGVLYDSARPDRDR